VSCAITRQHFTQGWLCVIRIEPFIYRTLAKYSSRDGTAAVKKYPLLQEFRNNHEVSPRLRKACSYAKHVLLHGLDIDEVVKILEICPNVHDLAVWLIDRNSTKLMDVISTLPIKRLSVNLCILGCTGFDDDRFDTTIFQRLPHTLTHLDAVNITEPFWVNECSGFAVLPNLTHLAVSGRTSQNIVEPILLACPSLKLFIKFGDFHFFSPEPSWVEDPRLVSLPSPFPSIDHWCRGARTGVDFWTKGEQIRRDNAS